MLDLATALEWMQAIPWGAAYFALFLGAFGEYIVPIIPGDVIILAGAVLVTVFGWPVLPVFLLVTAGTVLGATTAWFFGGWLASSGRLATISPRWRRGIDSVLARFDRHGPAILIFNRFFPGIRGFFFIAAGITKVPLFATVAYSAIGGALWNALLLVGGWAIGSNLDKLGQILTSSTLILGTIVAVIVALVAYKTWRELKDQDVPV